MNKKWYIVAQSSEGCELSVIDLSDEERNVVNRFLNQRTIAREGEWIGGIRIYDEAFDTKEEALKAVWDGLY